MTALESLTFLKSPVPKRRPGRPASRITPAAVQASTLNADLKTELLRLVENYETTDRKEETLAQWRDLWAEQINTAEFAKGLDDVLQHEPGKLGSGLHKPRELEFFILWSVTPYGLRWPTTITALAEKLRVSTAILYQWGKRPKVHAFISAWRPKIIGAAREQVLLNVPEIIQAQIDGAKTGDPANYDRCATLIEVKTPAAVSMNFTLEQLARESNNAPEAPSWANEAIDVAPTQIEAE